MIRKRKNFLVYKTKRCLIFLFCSKLIFSQSVSYYSKSVNPGKSNEFTQDFTIYRIGKEIRASYRTISGGYDSPNCYCFGEADTDNQSIIYLNSICSSEGESYDGGEIKVEFKLNNSQLNLNGEILKKAEQVNSTLYEWYGTIPTLDDILKITPPLGKTKEKIERKLILTTQNTDKFKKLINNYFKDLEATHRTSKPKSKIEVYPFLGTPVNLASFLFEKTDIIPNGIKKQKLDNSNIGFIYKTCPDDYNIEEDYDGKCRRYIFNQKKSKSSKDQIDVELEIHTTCLDDSCWYEYHILEFERGMDSGWLIVSHKKGNRCYEDRGGGSPPCL